MLPLAVSTARADEWLAQMQGDGIQANGRGPTREAAMAAAKADYDRQVAARAAERERVAAERSRESHDRPNVGGGGASAGRGEAMGERNANRR